MRWGGVASSVEALHSLHTAPHQILAIVSIGGGSQNYGHLSWRSPILEEYGIWGSILGSPYFGKLPYVLRFIVLIVQTVTGWGQYPIHIALV